MIIIIKYHQYY